MVLGVEEELLSATLVVEASDEAVENEFMDTRPSLATACCEGRHLADKLQAVFTDVLVPSIEFRSAVDCRMAWLKAIYCTCRVIVSSQPMSPG